jgi:hypothetical protein
VVVVVVFGVALLKGDATVDAAPLSPLESRGGVIEKLVLILGGSCGLSPFRIACINRLVISSYEALGKLNDTFGRPFSKVTFTSVPVVFGKKTELSCPFTMFTVLGDGFINSSCAFGENASLLDSGADDGTYGATSALNPYTPFAAKLSPDISVFISCCRCKIAIPDPMIFSSVKN